MTLTGGLVSHECQYIESDYSTVRMRKQSCTLNTHSVKATCVHRDLIWVREPMVVIADFRSAHPSVTEGIVGEVRGPATWNARLDDPSSEFGNAAESSVGRRS